MKPLKQDDLEVSYEYVPAPDAQERLRLIFEFLLSEDAPVDKPGTERYNEHKTNRALP